MQTVDYVDGISGSLERFNNEAFTLQCLSRGLAAIDHSVRQLEHSIREQDKRNRVKSYFFGFDFLGQYGIDPSVEYLIPCYFHWFATTVCNYARLVGLFKAVQSGTVDPTRLYDSSAGKAIKEACKDYVGSIDELRPVLRWRNKVSAHFAVTDPRQEDSEDDLLASAISPLEFHNQRFHVGTALIGAQAEAIGKWSITETFEALAPRFWPEYSSYAVGERA